VLLYSPQKNITGQSDILGASHDSGLSVLEIDRERCNRLIKSKHYSGTIVNNSYIHLGIFRGGALLGAMQFGYALNPSSMCRLFAGMGNNQYLELNRMWLDDSLERNSESICISLAIKFIKNKYKTVKVIQSFADERCGGLGVVYQAANFLFYGTHDSTFVVYEGRTYHKIAATTLSGKGGNISKILVPLFKDGALETKSFRQFRYIYFIDRSYIAKCALPNLPYPKREPCATPS
jgi:hypothetical protein